MKKVCKRQNEIIEEAIKIISKKGIQNLTLKNLAKTVGISEPAIYRYFENKMEILLGILSRFEKYIHIKKNSNDVKKKKYLKQIESIYFDHFKRFSETPELAAVIFSEEIFQDDKRLAEKIHSIMNSNYEVITTIIKKGQQEREIRKDIEEKQLALIIMGALRLIVAKWKLSDFSFNLEEEGAKLWNSIKKILEGK